MTGPEQTGNASATGRRAPISGAVRSVLPILLAVGCGPSDPEAVRHAWVLDVLHQDNLVWMSRDPALLEAKYATMAADPYDWMRGSLAVFLGDVARPEDDGIRTAFLREPDSAQISLVGDPHPENVGLFAAGTLGTALVLEAADLDGAAFGPYLVDTRRGLLGLAALLEFAGCDLDCREPVLTAWADGWLAEIAATDPWSPALLEGRVDPVVARALDEVLVEGGARLVLLESTEPTSGERRLRKSPGPLTDGLATLAPEEAAQLDRLLETMPVPAGFRRLDAARRYGVGVASLPAVRYAVLWDTGQAGDADDALLQLREVVDPPIYPGVTAPGTWDSAADRIEGTATLAWSRPDVDPLLAAVEDGGMVFRASTWSSWNQTLDHESIAEDLARGRVNVADLPAFAATLGRQLGSVHARAVTPDGTPAVGALRAETVGREAAFVDEQLRAAEQDLATALGDHQRFGAAIAAGELDLADL